MAGKLKPRDSLAHTIPHERSFDGEITIDDFASLGRRTTTSNGRHQLGPPFLVSQIMPSYPAISLMPPAEGRALERLKDLKFGDTGVLLRAPAEARQASRPRISAARDYIPLPRAMRIDTFLERL